MSRKQKKSEHYSERLYREGRDEVARQVSGKERWVDHGMGSSVAQIIDTCDGYSSEHVWISASSSIPILTL